MDISWSLTQVPLQYFATVTPPATVYRRLSIISLNTFFDVARLPQYFHYERWGAIICRKCSLWKPDLSGLARIAMVSDEGCIICLKIKTSGEKQPVSLCKHPFHETCTREWLMIQNKCPLVVGIGFSRLTREGRSGYGNLWAWRNILETWPYVTWWIYSCHLARGRKFIAARVGTWVGWRWET